MRAAIYGALALAALSVTSFGQVELRYAPEEGVVLVFGKEILLRESIVAHPSDLPLHGRRQRLGGV